MGASAFSMATGSPTDCRGAAAPAERPHNPCREAGAGARSAVNPHAACDVAGTGNGITVTSTRARRGKPSIQPRSGLRVTASVPDPTKSPEAIRSAVPTLTLEQVYGAITFYLGHRAEVDEDIANREREENAFSETHPAPADLKEKLDRARRQPQSR